MVGDEVLRNPNRVYKRRDAVNSSSPSSSSSSYSSLSPASEDGGLDWMELEAARALACISGTAVRESGGRRLQRFESRSPVRVWEIRDQGWDLASVPEDNEAIGVMVEDKIKAEHISEILPRSTICSTNSLSSSGRKTRLNPTEVERDAMRMRRVLANRESARQTIQRRQAFRDGLKKKVSDLSSVNQNMKIEKGQIMKEYLSLRNKNKKLKTELAMAIACNIMGVDVTSHKAPEAETPCSRFCSKAAVAEEKPAMNEQYQSENYATDSAPPLKDEATNPKPSLDASNHFSSVSGEPVRPFVEQPAKFLDANVAASARRRRKEIIKLKHLCGRPIFLHN